MGINSLRNICRIIHYIVNPLHGSTHFLHVLARGDHPVDRAEERGHKRLERKQHTCREMTIHDKPDTNRKHKNTGQCLSQA